MLKFKHFGFVFIILISINHRGFTQKVKVAIVTETMRVESNISLDACKKKLLESARINAVIQAFGEVIMQGNSMYVRNVQDGTEAKSQTVFNQISDTYVNGEWLEDVDEPVFKKIVKNNEDWLEIKLKCKVRELPKNKIDFEVKTLSCPEIKCKTDMFNDGQDFFVSFKSPVDGYLSIYLEVPNEQMSYRIFPYKKQNAATCVKVNGDEEYILFSDKLNKFSFISNSLIDNLMLSLADGKSAEQNALVVIFSPSEILDKPILEDKSENSNENQLQIPMSISIKEFEEWVLRTKRKDENISTLKTFISINPQ
jgi:hypothetical protein